MKNNDTFAPVLKPIAAALLLGAASYAVQAAEPVTPPGAGSILQQIQPLKPATPSASGTGLSIEREGAQLPPSAPFRVARIQISGNTAFDTETLHKLVADVEGKTLTLTQLGEAVARITDYYRHHGYPLARAIVPAQTIQDGVVHVQVIEARYGQIKLDNRSRVSNDLLQGTLEPLQAGQMVSQGPLDHVLLLLSDIPGLVNKVILKPGATVGASDLQVQSDATATVMGSATLDNDGNPYTGRTRLGATVNVIDPMHHGDVLSFGVLSAGDGMNYGSIVYETLLNGLGTRLGGSFSALHYVLGDNLSALDGHGTAQVASLWIKHPFIRSYNDNLYGQFEYDYKQLDDDIDASGIETDRHVENLVASLNGDWRQNLLAGGQGTWNVSWTTGKVAFDNANAQLADAATANTQGGFTKWNGAIAHLQNLDQNNALYLTLTGQLANGNLDPAEKMVAGGPTTVRAYDNAAASGDTGVLGSLELRHNLRQHWGQQWQLLAFVDSEHINFNKNPWLTGDNSATLSGAGLGLNWFGPDQWHAKLVVAAPFGPSSQLVAGTQSTHAWAELGKGF